MKKRKPITFTTKELELLQELVEVDMEIEEELHYFIPIDYKSHDLGMLEIILHKIEKALGKD